MLDLRPKSYLIEWGRLGFAELMRVGPVLAVASFKQSMAGTELSVPPLPKHTGVPGFWSQH